jgi:NAD(P)-dependent dehydrogenase (short-subunit alcohol dehydrogenase family)
MPRLDGKVVVITGSASGIGRHVAKTYAQAGAAIVVTDVKPLATIAGELKGLGAEHLAVPTDVSDPDAVRELMHRAVERFGRIDVLHNNAAIVTHFHWGIPHWPRLRDLEPDFWNRVIQTNLGGTFLCSKYALPVMEAQRSGHIINTMGDSDPRRVGAAPYSVSKHAILRLTQFLAEEERAYGICVVAMSPGGRIATEDASAEAQTQWPGVASVGDRYVYAAQADLDLSGHLVAVEDGELVIAPLGPGPSRD